MKVSDLVRELRSMPSDREVLLPKKVFYIEGEPCYFDKIGIKGVVIDKKINNSESDVLIIPEYE